MRRYVVALQARQDVRDIIAYIATANPPAAARLRDRLSVAFQRLAQQPGLGHTRNDLAPSIPDVRFWVVGTCLVIYRPRGGSIEIVRVLDGRRDILTILARDARIPER